MLKEHYATHSGGFGGILGKFNMAGISGKLKTLNEYIQWKRLESILLTEPPELQSELSPYIQQRIKELN